MHGPAHSTRGLEESVGVCELRHVQATKAEVAKPSSQSSQSELDAHDGRALLMQLRATSLEP